MHFLQMVCIIIPEDVYFTYYLYHITLCLEGSRSLTTHAAVNISLLDFCDQPDDS
jgi:hypothetical protein